MPSTPNSTNTQRRGSRRSGSMLSHSDEGNRFANVPKDWTDELSSQHRGLRQRTQDGA